MQFPTLTSPHGPLPNDIQTQMFWVILALVPGTFAMAFYFGPGVIINMLIANAAAVGFEALMLRLRGRSLAPLFDLSAVVTGVLFALAVPPLLPWWLTVLGVGFAIVVAKHLYGGLGYNPFNPAMAGYVLLLISYPVEMTTWVPPEMLNAEPLNFAQTLRVIFSGELPPGLTWDAVTMATPLDAMRTGLDQEKMISEIRLSPLWGDFGGQGWEWVGNWYLLGGLLLLYKRVISWHIPVAMLGALLAVAMVFYIGDPETHPFGLFHLFSGGAMLGAFFIATDPVTASTTPRGRLIYGACIGLLVFVIRSWGGYPDAVAFAVLLMNMAAPTIDYYTQPRVFGERGATDE
jgi:electron transport complex protein RnfD